MKYDASFSIVFYILVTFSFVVGNYMYKNLMLLNNTVKPATYLSVLLTRSYAFDETLLFVSCRRKNVFILPIVSNPRFVLDVDKTITPLKRPNDIYNNYVICSEDEASLEVTLRKLNKTPIWDVSTSPRGKYVVVTSTTKSLERLFELFWGFHIMNVVLVVYNDQNHNYVPNLYTSNPFANGGKCGRKAQLDTAQQCDGSTRITFTKSFRNLSECTVKLVSPMELRRDMKSEGSFTLLASILEMISKVINTSTSLEASLNKMEVLYNSSDDIVLAPEISRASELYRDYDLSDFLLRDQPIWLVPKPPLISNIKIITTVFDRTVWFATLATLALSVSAWWMTAKLEGGDSKPNNLSYSFLRVWGFLFGMSDDFLTSLRALRILAMFYLIYSILMTCCFQARLASVLAQPGRESPIRSVEELSESGLWVLMTEGFLSVTSGLTDQDGFFSRLYRNAFVLDNLNLTEIVTLVAYHSNYTSSFGWIALSWFPKEKTMLEVIEHDTGTLPVDISFSMRKGHYIMNTLNEISRRVIESGVQGKLFSDAAGLSYSTIVDNSETVLTLNHLGGVFIWWAAGLVVAFLVFLAETTVIRYKKSNQRHDFTRSLII